MTEQHPSGQNSTAVTVVGLGPMGLVLAETLLGKGLTLTVWNRTPGKADALAAKGARRAATVAEAVAASPVTILCPTTTRPRTASSTPPVPPSRAARW
ncbi:NAD(P)-binding domain-containing protein [Nonomuraea sp. NPDC023979]|uniref:NAD(P)-binding domain-containing protein n=1 Tax=Nonomuraea sp. NPDC023979 TaxID=3154796 RepID=UPI0033EDEC01